MVAQGAVKLCLLISQTSTVSGGVWSASHCAHFSVVLEATDNHSFGYKSQSKHYEQMCAPRPTSFPVRSLARLKYTY
jgi:hypothetical protein